jgi:purine-binding chemotaxis protein CheW
LNEPTQIIQFLLDSSRYGLPLANVERIVRAVEITPLPAGPEIALGIINVAGKLHPVLDIRGRFGLPRREISPENHFLIVKTPGRSVVFAVDEVCGLIEQRCQIVPPDDIIRGIEHLRGVIKLEGSLVLIQDVEAFLSLDEAQALDAAVEKENSHAG